MRPRLFFKFSLLLLVVLHSQAFAQQLNFTQLLNLNTGGAEITAFDPVNQRLFVTDAGNSQVLIYDMSNPASGNASQVGSIVIANGEPTSVAVANQIVAVAVASNPKTDPGQVLFFTPAGTPLGQVTVGALPDNVVFSSDGNLVLTANEGEPDDNTGIDPEGSVSVIDISAGIASAITATINFQDFNAGGSRAAELPAEVRIFGFDGSGAQSVAQDLEPEYLALRADNSTAYVSLQENNAIAILDINNLSVIAIVAAGEKDYSLPGNTLDASDRDNAINLQNWPVTGLYQPDTVATATINGQTYLFTANEGDARDFEEERLENLTLDPTIFPNASDLQLEQNLGRLEVTTVDSDPDNDGVVEEIVAYGARSFAIYDASGQQVYESGDELERRTVELDIFIDSRSDAKGPEPEGIAVAQIAGDWLAFIGLERSGGVLVYNVNRPSRPGFVGYMPTSPQDGEPEGLLVIAADDSPTGEPLLVVASEDSGSVEVFALTYTPAERLPSTVAVPMLSPQLLLILVFTLLLTGSISLKLYRL